jgi:hypothetical protein
MEQRRVAVSALLEDAWSSSSASKRSVTALSWVEQSAEAAIGPSQVVRCERLVEVDAGYCIPSRTSGRGRGWEQTAACSEAQARDPLPLPDQTGNDSRACVASDV